MSTPRTSEATWVGDRVPTGVPVLDRLLGGGLESDGLTEIYGEGGSGKSVFCLGAAVRLALQDRWVFYVDTEGLSVDRLRAVAGDRTDAVLSRLLVSSPGNLEEQTKAVRTACALAREGKRPVGLLVLDSATLHYRLTIGDSAEDEGRQQLSLQLADMLATAIQAHVPAVFTNQVWRNVTTGALEPLGGSFVNHAAKTILRFDRLKGDRRRAVLVKHRSLPEVSAEFRITATGLE